MKIEQFLELRAEAIGDQQVLQPNGAARDLDACRELGFSVYARGAVPITARGRIMQEAFNCMIRLGDVQVRPGDVIECYRVETIQRSL